MYIYPILATWVVCAARPSCHSPADCSSTSNRGIVSRYQQPEAAHPYSTTPGRTCGPRPWLSR